MRRKRDLAFEQQGHTSGVGRFVALEAFRVLWFQTFGVWATGFGFENMGLRDALGLSGFRIPAFF